MAQIFLLICIELPIRCAQATATSTFSLGFLYTDGCITPSPILLYFVELFSPSRWLSATAETRRSWREKAPIPHIPQAPPLPFSWWLWPSDQLLNVDTPKDTVQQYALECWRILSAHKSPSKDPGLPVCVAMDQGEKSMNLHLTRLESDLRTTEAHLRRLESLSTQYDSVILSFAL